MGYDEFYTGNEYKGANEHAILKIEIFPNKENVLLHENKIVKEENTISRKNQPTETGKYKNNKQSKQNNDSTNNSKNISTNTSTTNIVRTTSIVSAGAVVVASISIALAAPPLIELLNFNVGGDYLDYTLETSELVDGISYFVEINNQDNFHYKKQIETPGIFNEIVNGLTPNTYYSYKFIGYDSTQEYEIYLQREFYTEYDYLATFNKLSIEECTVKWTYLYNEIKDTYDDIYRIIIPTKFNNDTEQNYQYRITLFNEDGLNEVYQGISPEVVFDIPRTYTSASLKYESIIINNGEEKVCDTIITNSYIFKPEFKINEIGIDYYTNNAFADIVLNAPDTYKIYHYTSLDPEPQEIYAGYKSFLTYPTEETTYYFYMVNDLGEQISENMQYTLSPINTVESKFTYLNPSEITVTYNDNGSINAYFDTKFECEDPDVYYEIQLVDEEYSNVSYISKNRYAAIEDFINYGNRGVSYNVFKIIDGIKHCFWTTTPSGTLTLLDNEGAVNCYIDTDSNPPVFNLNTYNGFQLDPTSMYLMLDNNQRINIDSNLLIKDEYGDYALTLELPIGITSGKLYVTGSALYNDYDIFKDIKEMNIKGNCYTQVVIDF